MNQPYVGRSLPAHHRWLNLIVAWLLLTGAAAAGDLFVNNATGDDVRNGRSLESKGAAGGPVRTIAQALRLARAGDRIVLA